MFLFLIIENQLLMVEELFRRLFSPQCQLRTLRLDIDYILTNSTLRSCLQGNSSLSTNFIQHQLEFCCVTLRQLHIRVICTFVLENLVQRLPNLEKLSVEFDFSLGFDSSGKWNVNTLKQSNENWFNKVRKTNENVFRFISSIFFK